MPQADPRGAIGYARVSSEDQVKGYSLEHQRAVISACCLRHQIPLTEIIANDEHGESATSLERSAFLQVLERVRRGGIGWVVVSRIDRLSRSLEDICGLLAEWRDLKVQIIAPEDQLDDPTYSGSAMDIQIRTWLAENERRRIVSRIRPGLAARVESGLPLGRVSFGYRIQAPVAGTVGRAREALVPDPITAPMVVGIFTKAEQSDWGSRRLADWANDQFPPHTFTPGMIAGLLVNPIYIGHLHATVDGKDHVHPDNHPPIIPLDQFLRVQQLRTQRQQDFAAAGGSGAASSWLGGLVRCGICKKAHLTQKGDTYICQSQCQKGGGCPAPAWLKIPLENFVSYQLQDELSKRVEDLRDLVDGSITSLPGHLDERRAAAQTLLDAYERAVGELLAQLEAGIVIPTAYMQSLQRWEARKAAAETLLDEVDGDTYLAHLIRAQEPDTTGPTSRRWVPFQLGLAKLSLPELRRLLRTATDSMEAIEEYPFCRMIFSRKRSAFAELGKGLARYLSQSPGYRIDDLPPGAWKKM